MRIASHRRRLCAYTLESIERAVLRALCVCLRQSTQGLMTGFADELFCHGVCPRFGLLTWSSVTDLVTVQRLFTRCFPLVCVCRCGAFVVYCAMVVLLSDKPLLCAMCAIVCLAL